MKYYSISCICYDFSILYIHSPPQNKNPVFVLDVWSMGGWTTLRLATLGFGDEFCTIESERQGVGVERGPLKMEEDSGGGG